MATTKSAVLLFPHQLFEKVIFDAPKSLIILIEDDLLFKQYKFHKQKLVLHRTSILAFKDRLEKEGLRVEHIKTGSGSSMNLLESIVVKNHINHVSYYDLVDDWLDKKVTRFLQKHKLDFEIWSSPGFLTSRGAIEDYFSHSPNRMQSFYVWQRKRLNILIEDGKPTGGQWSYDEKNRKPLPKHISLPPPYTFTENSHVQEALTAIDTDFSDNVGTTNGFNYATTHEQAHMVLKQFLQHRLASFGPYEDAIASSQSQLFHSVLSPLLNIGLLTPRQVITSTLQHATKHAVPIESLEGFIRQIIGWREYMRATYIQFGSQMRTKNHLNHTRPLSKGWWNGSVGIEPIDQTICRVLETSYAHHIERLMILGNAMLLLRTHPDEVYEWFMCLFIDAYDWVMVPNVYAMSQFAVENMITTKPYISGSNYVIKMSDYKKGDWGDIWDALYWRFIADNRQLFEANPRASMMVKLLDKQTAEKKQLTTRLSNEWLS